MTCPVTRAALAILFFVLAMLAMIPAAHSQSDEEYDEEWIEPVSGFGDWSDEETVALLTVVSLGTAALNVENVWNGHGSTTGGLFTMIVGGSSMAFGFEKDRSLVTAAGAFAFVIGLASLANSLTAPPPAQTGVTAEPFVEEIAGDTHVGLMARIRY